MDLFLVASSSNYHNNLLGSLQKVCQSLVARSWARFNTEWPEEVKSGQFPNDQGRGRREYEGNSRELSQVQFQRKRKL